MGVPFFGWAARKLFGTRNQRQVSRYLEKVEKVNAFEEQMRSLSDAELRDRTAEFRRHPSARRGPKHVGRHRRQSTSGVARRLGQGRR